MLLTAVLAHFYLLLTTRSHLLLLASDYTYLLLLLTTALTYLLLLTSDCRTYLLLLTSGYARSLTSTYFRLRALACLLLSN